MKPAKLLISLSAVFSAILLPHVTMPEPASANVGRVRSICIDNDTSFPVQYSIRWKDGNWKTWTLDPESQGGSDERRHWVATDVYGDWDISLDVDLSSRENIRNYNNLRGKPNITRTCSDSEIYEITVNSWSSTLQVQRRY